MAKTIPRGDLDFLSGGGTMGQLMRELDWDATVLGPPDTWSQSLKVCVRLMLNTRHPMVIFWGPQLDCLYNDAYRPSIGPERHPGAVGRPGRAVWEETWPVVGPQIDQVMAGGGSTWFEDQLIPITRHGALEDVYWTYSYSPIDDDTAPNGIGGVLVVCRETTDQVMGRQALARSDERLRLALSSGGGIGTWDWDVPNDRVFADDHFARLYGVDPADAARGAPIARFFNGIHPDDRAPLQERIDAALATGGTFGAEYRLLHADRDECWVIAEGRCELAADGKPERFAGVSFDITERKRAELRLRESEEQLRLATDVAEIGLWDVDPVADVLFWPPRVKAMFGISPDVPVSMADFYAGLHPDDRAHTAASYAAAADPAVRGLYDVEYRTIGKEDGVIRWIAAKGRGIFEGDRCIRILGTAIDVTERQLARDRLRDLNETLERRVAEAIAERAAAEEKLRQAQKIEAIGQLTGGVAHDFNNLLMVISGGLSILDRQDDPLRRRRIMDGMQQAADRGASLTRQLLAFSRRQPLKADAVDLRHQIDGMGELLDRTLRGDVTVTTALAADLWPVLVDPAELELVLLNLCVNARDAIPDGGTVTISAKNAAPADHGLSGDFVRLAVSDTGQGMSPETLARVFEPFFTTKDIGKGSGLGLPQVYGFAHQSGGTVTIDSAVGQGTTVALFLPRTTTQPAIVARQPSEVAIAAAHVCGTVLLVEDELPVAALVGEMLGQLGYRVDHATDARMALDILSDGRPVDLVVSDYMMPGAMNGVELARAVQHRRPGLPILLTSGYAEAALQEASECGVPILRKPYDLAALDKALRAIERD